MSKFKPGDRVKYNKERYHTTKQENYRGSVLRVTEHWGFAHGKVTVKWDHRKTPQLMDGYYLSLIEKPEENVPQEQVCTQISMAWAVLTTVCRDDSAYAWSVHCMVRKGLIEIGLDEMSANIGAAAVMQHLFNADTRFVPNNAVSKDTTE